MRFHNFVITFLSLFYLQPAYGQTETLDEARLFQTFARDAAISEVIYGISGFTYGDFDAANATFLEARIGFPINQNIEIGVESQFINVDPDGGKSQSGFADLTLFGRHHFLSKRTQ